MKRYFKYKNSGKPWIGDIPAIWDVVRLKYVSDNTPSNVDKKTEDDEKKVKLCNYVEVYKNDFITKTMPFMEATASQIQIEKFLLKKGYVIATKDSETADDIAKPAYVLEDLGNVVCGYHLTLMKPNELILHGKYLFNLFKSPYINSFFEINARGVTRFGLPTSAFNDVYIPLPSIDEQINIANYLDRKTSQIDTLISKKEKLIELLQEERTAIINQAVTKGIDPNVPMKYSGIEWLGEIPEHWEITRLKYIISGLVSGTSVNSTDAPIEANNEIGILKTSCVYNYEFNPKQNKQVVKEEYHKVKCPVTKNSIIISRMNTPELVGASGYVESDYLNIFLPDRLWKTVFFEDLDINTKWLSRVFISNVYRSVISSRATGTSSSMKNISKEDFLTLPLGLPPRNEQDEIEKYLKNQTDILNKSILKILQEIDLLSEYKAALISEVVTGKIDVRDEV